jgi:hypothetical protein
MLREGYKRWQLEAEDIVVFSHTFLTLSAILDYRPVSPCTLGNWVSGKLHGFIIEYELIIRMPELKIEIKTGFKKI